MAQARPYSTKSHEVLGAGTSIVRALRLSEEARLVRPIAQSPIVFACVRVNADAFAGIPRLIVGPDEEELPEGNQLAALLHRPNPLMSGRKLQRCMSQFLDMAGGFFLFLNGVGTNKDGRRVLTPIEPGQFPSEIWPVRDDLVEPVIDPRSKVPTGWTFRMGGQVVEYPDHAVAHIYHPDPHDPLRGLGALQAAWRSADHLFRSEAFDDALVENGGQMAGYFTHERPNVDRDPRKRDTLEKSVDEGITKPRNHRRMRVLPAGVKFTPAQLKPVDMDATNLRKMKKEEIAEIFGVPPVMLGRLEDANRSSLREQRRVYYENTVAPRAEFIEEELAMHLLSRLPEQFHDLRIVFDVDDTPAMREDVDQKIDRMEKLVGMGVPVGMAAEQAGLALEAFEGDDARFLSSSLRPMDLAMAEPEEPEPEADEPEEERIYRASSRESAVAAEEARLAKADRRVKRAVRRVFDDYVQAQVKRVREVANGSGPTASVTPWSWLTESGQWSASAWQACAVMDWHPDDCAEGWTSDAGRTMESEAGFVTVRGISEDELLALVLGNEAQWGEELWGAIDGPIKGAIEEAAKAAAVGSSIVDATDPEMVRYLQAKEVQLVEGPMSVVAEQVKRALIAGLAGAPDEGTLADRVRAALEEVESELRALKGRLGTRAAMIARTETASASNAARSLQYQRDGIAQHEWVSAGDDLVRDGHDIDGEVVIVGEPFSNGLRWPLDPLGEAGEIINCRCLTIPVVE